MKSKARTQKDTLRLGSGRARESGGKQLEYRYLDNEVRRSQRAASGFQAVTRFGQRVESPPYQTIGSHDSCSHQDSGGEEQIEVAGVGRLTDRGTKANRGVSVAFEVEVLGDDACIPCAT